MKILINKNVYDATLERISFAFNNFKKLYVSFSGGKDSTVMTHMVLEEARKRQQKVGLLFIDRECQFDITIEHIKDIYQQYSDIIEPYRLQIPLLTDNACSQYEPEWICRDESKQNLWVRQKDQLAIKDPSAFPFYTDNMTFEEFVPLFGKWYSQGESTCCFVGIRTMESLNRFRAIARGDKKLLDNKPYTTSVIDNVRNIYPIYDRDVKDIWTYIGKYKKSYNKLYDRMYQAGLSLSQMRVDEPFGDTTRKSLWLYSVIEPKTWGKLVCRVEGAGYGSLYGKTNGNILGNGQITLPKGHTRQSFSMFLLGTIPPKTAEHFKSKIAVYIKWYMDRGYPDGIPDEGDRSMEMKELIPSWRRICRCILKNDYWCKSLGFSPTKTSAYQNYLDRMKKNRDKWNILK